MKAKRKMPPMKLDSKQKSETAVNNKTGLLRHVSRFSKPQLMVFALIFASIGGIIIYKSLAATYPPTSLYASTSPWNTPLPASPTIYSGSAAMVQSMVDQANSSTGFTMAVGNYSIPIYYADSTTPRYDMTITTYNPGVMHNVPIPTGAKADAGTDHHLMVIDTSTNTEYDFFNVLNGDISTHTAKGGVTTSSIGSGVISSAFASMRGSGFALGGGVIRPDEMAAGQINHALGLVTSNNSPVIWPPATESDGQHSGTSAVPMGARVQLDPSFNVDSQPWSAWQKTIAKAIQQYGMIVFDSTTSGMSLQAQNPVSFTSPSYPWGTTSYPDMKWLPVSKFRVLDPKQSTSSSAPVVSLSASPATITSGASSNLTWNSTNATACSASGAWSGSLATSGTKTVSPTTTSTYSITCTGAGGSASAYTTINTSTAPPPTVLSVTQSIQNNSSLAGSITWEAYPTGSTISQVVFSIDGTPKFTEYLSPFVYNGDGNKLDTTMLSNGTHTFKVVATASDGTTAETTSTATVGNALPPPAPTVSLTASPSSIASGGSSNLTWTSTNAASCTASNAWSGSKAISGTQAVSPTATSTYSLSCTGSGGTTTTSVAITVNAAPPSGDTTKPSTPGNLRVTATGKNNVTLAWDASTDNVGVAGYKLYRSTSTVYSGTSLSFNNTGLSPGSSYTYSVAAYDQAGNTSSQSQKVCVGKWTWWSNVSRTRSWNYC